jgi:hypothetical protein
LVIVSPRALKISGPALRSRSLLSVRLRRVTGDALSDVVCVAWTWLHGQESSARALTADLAMGPICSRECGGWPGPVGHGKRRGEVHFSFRNASSLSYLPTFFNAQPINQHAFATPRGKSTMLFTDSQVSGVNRWNVYCLQLQWGERVVFFLNKKSFIWACVYCMLPRARSPGRLVLFVASLVS